MYFAQALLKTISHPSALLLLSTSYHLIHFRSSKLSELIVDRNKHGEMVQCLRALVVLRVDPDLILSTHMVVHNNL